ncbi:hypothetical protein [Streptosporangium sp. NPDC002524]|uniref:hypothetical protein n=1 Tax=Streptosporangium sp. NPDC002524 TaxID=3154537 RepID=UPI00332BCA0B
MSKPTVFYSVDVRPAGGKTLGKDEVGELLVIARVHLDIPVDTIYRETVLGPGSRVGPVLPEDFGALDPGQVVDDAVYLVWEAATGSDTVPDPLQELRLLLNAYAEARTQGADPPFSGERPPYDEIGHQVAEYVEKLLGSPRPSLPGSEDQEAPTI